MDTRNNFDVNKFKDLGKYMNYNLNMPNFKEINGVIYKLCTKCKKYKPMTIDYFHPRNTVKCGFDSHCKDCTKEKESKRVRVLSFNENGELFCQICKQYKPIEEFTTGSGIKCRNDRSRECRHCESERKKIRRASLELNNQDKHLRQIWHGCKTRALQAKIPYDLDVEYLVELYNKQDGKCALSGMVLENFVRSGKNVYNTSVDRIIPNLGYVKGNVRLVCAQVNMMRSNMEDCELIKICRNIVNYWDEQNTHKERE